jgi:hypothetical protein
MFIDNQIKWALSIFQIKDWGLQEKKPKMGEGILFGNKFEIHRENVVGIQIHNSELWILLKDRKTGEYFGEWVKFETLNFTEKEKSILLNHILTYQQEDRRLDLHSKLMAEYSVYIRDYLLTFNKKYFTFDQKRLNYDETFNRYLEKLIPEKYKNIVGIALNLGNAGDLDIICDEEIDYHYIKIDKKGNAAKPCCKTENAKSETDDHSMSIKST